MAATARSEVWQHSSTTIRLEHPLPSSGPHLAVKWPAFCVARQRAASDDSIKGDPACRSPVGQALLFQDVIAGNAREMQWRNRSTPLHIGSPLAVVTESTHVLLVCRRRGEAQDLYRNRAMQRPSQFPYSRQPILHAAHVWCMGLEQKPYSSLTVHKHH